jgi:hypothetical protein
MLMGIGTHLADAYLQHAFGDQIVFDDTRSVWCSASVLLPDMQMVEASSFSCLIGHATVKKQEIF